MALSTGDLGLKRFSLIVIIYNLLMILFILLYWKNIFYQSGVIVIVSALLYKYSNKIVQKGDRYLFAGHIIQLLTLMWFNYDLVGNINRSIGGFVLTDRYFSAIDHFLFGMPLAAWGRSYLGHLKLLYDSMIISYILYFLYPFYGIIMFGINKSKRNEYTRYISSIVSLLIVGVTLYLIFPTTGPQYYLKDTLSLPLPFYEMGRFLHHQLTQLHTNKIDCFPSLHAAIAVIVSFWAFKMKFTLRYLLLVISSLMLGATMLLRYHYLADVLAGIMLAIICYKMSKYIRLI